MKLVLALNETLAFVDLRLGSILYSTVKVLRKPNHAFLTMPKYREFGATAVTEAGIVWHWDPVSEKLRKITPNGESVAIGKIAGSAGLRILHADSDDNVFFMADT